MAVTDRASAVQELDAVIDQSDDDNLSIAVDLHGYTLVAIGFPAAMTSSNVTFPVSVDNLTYREATAFEDSTTDYSLAVTASKHVPVDVRVFAGARWIKVATDGNEATDRTIKLFVIPGIAS